MLQHLADEYLIDAIDLLHPTKMSLRLSVMTCQTEAHPRLRIPFRMPPPSTNVGKDIVVFLLVVADVLFDA